MKSAILAMLLASASIVAQTVAQAPTEEAAFHRMLEARRDIHAQILSEAQQITANAASELASPAHWESVRARRLEEMRDMLGLLPWPARTPLNVKVTGVLDKGFYTIEKIAFESMPHIYVTGNLYLPKDRSKPLPAVIYVCGHAYSPHGDKTYYQRHGISLAKNGYAAFILDSIQIAETFALHHGVFNQEMWDWYSRGYTPAGVEVWNAMRALDYLETRPEIDASRFAITGRSGGAAMSWFTAAVDPRIRVAIPVMGISTNAANVEAGTQQGHCDCMFCINFYKQDMLHQGALIAPRPLLMMHGAKDNLFPVKGYTEFEHVVGKLYQGYGRADDFQNIVVDTGHADSDYLREQAIHFLDKHLLGIPPRRLDMDYSNAPPEQLSVFGGSPPVDAQNFRIHETFTTHGPLECFESLAAWKGRRTALLATLQRLLPPTHDSFVPRTDLQKPPKVSGKLPAILYIASDGEDERYQSRLLRGAQSRGELVRMVVWPRGIGEIPFSRDTDRNFLRDAMLIGETLDSLRLRDVRAALQMLKEIPEVDPARITVAGRGVSGILGLYASILDPTILQVLLFAPPQSHREGPVFLNILRHTDLPEAAALLAPRRLLFYGHVPPAYAHTEHLYRLQGADDRLSVAMNIEYVATGNYGYGMASGD